MKKVPYESAPFACWDINILGDEIYDAYSEWKAEEKAGLAEIGIKTTEVDSLACVQVSAEGEEVRIIKGSFILESIREKLESQGYSKSWDNDIEKWTKDGKAVALVEDTVIIGNEESIEACIDVIQGNKHSLWDDSSVRDVVDKLPSGIMEWVKKEGEEPQFKDLSAWGLSVEEKDGSNLRVEAVFRFAVGGAANASLNSIKDYLEGLNFRSVETRQESEFVIATAIADIDDFHYSTYSFPFE